MKFVVLLENHALDKKLKQEHGLSVYVEKDGFRMVLDMGETGLKFQNWWDRMGEKYQWESIEGGNWEIDFDTCNIYLTDNN